MISLGSIKNVFEKDDRKGTETELADDVLRIDCRGCSKAPDIRSTDCVRCIVTNITEYGNAGRIRLRTSRDLEIYGPAAEMFCELAMLYRSTLPFSSQNKQRSCSDCSNSCSRIMDMVWAGFPDPNFDSARGRLMAFRPTGSECNSCIQRTYRALEQTELGVNNLRKRISVEAARKGGI